MNKTELAAKWGKYTDTNKLVDDIATLFTTYNHRHSEHGICVMLDEYFTNKEPLIRLFATSNHYIGNMRIRLPKEMERYQSANEIRSFCNMFPINIKAYDIIWSYTDDNGKTMHDYLKTGSKLVNMSQFKNKTFIQQAAERKLNLSKFDLDGYTDQSKTKASNFASLMDYMGQNPQSLLQHNTAIYANRIDPSLKLREGLKTSRAFNKICEAYGLHNAEINVYERQDATTGEVKRANKYDKLFAEYSDMVSQLKRPVDFIISLNPYDYLTMSFGVNWASCHSIDKNNIRGINGSYHGQYCSGTMSYMLDKTSIITFVIDRNGDPQNDGKIYRNMFHYSDYRLLQARVYPQGNDGLTDLYTVFRTFVQEELSELLDVSQESWVDDGVRCRMMNEYTRTFGTHYKDYCFNSGCNISRISTKASATPIVKIEIGHDPICPRCGRTHANSNVLSHDYCD